MTFSEHLIELRSRLIKSLLALAAAFTVAMIYQEELLQVVTRPHFMAMELLKAEYPDLDAKFISGTYGSPVFAYMKLAFIVAAFVASPVIGYQIWRFVGAGLHVHERKWVLLFAPASFVLFVGGCLFGYFLMIPYGLYFLAKLSFPNISKPTYVISEYLDFVMLLTIIMGAVFQLPLVMTFFARIGLVTARGYLKFWRYAVVLIFIAAAVLTPSTDVVSQLVMAGPMLLLYFVGVAASAIFGHKREPPPQNETR